MRKLVVVGLFLFAVPNISHADEYFKFIKITCAKEIGLLEIQATGIANIGEYLNKKNIKKLEKERGLYLWQDHKDNSTYNCMLGDKEIITTMKYEKPKGSGQCGANSRAHMNIKINGTEVMRDVLFHEECFGRPSIFKVSISFMDSGPIIDAHVRKGEIYYDKGFSPWDLKKEIPITEDKLEPYKK